MSAVESFMNRVGLAEYYPAFHAKGLDRIVSVRKLDESQMAELIPDEEKRKLFRDELAGQSSAPNPADATARHADDTEARPRGNRRDGPQGQEHRRPRESRVCRDFFEGGCAYGDECRFSHDPAQHRAEGNAQSNVPLNREQYREEISVPWDSVKLLLGNKAEKLQRIHRKNGTVNSRFEKPEAYQQTFSFDIMGPPESVKKTKADIEYFVGITASKTREARFQYANHELERNRLSVEYLAAANAKHKGTPLELSSSVLQRVAKTFRFQQEPKVTQFWCLSSGTDKEKFETLMPLIKHLRGVQCIIFAEQKRVEEMAKRSKQTAEALGVKNPQFVHRNIAKEDRMKAFEAFKKGEVNEFGVRQRVLVTSYDFAKFARKIMIPHVNLVLHFSIPTKEMYLYQTNCTGRNGHEGISLLFVTHHDAATQKEWSSTMNLTELTGRAFEEAARQIAYDTETEPLTSEGAYPPANWREDLEREKGEKEVLKAEKEALKAKREAAKAEKDTKTEKTTAPTKP